MSMQMIFIASSVFQKGQKSLSCMRRKMSEAGRLETDNGHGHVRKADCYNKKIANSRAQYEFEDSQFYLLYVLRTV